MPRHVYIHLLYIYDQCYDIISLVYVTPMANINDTYEARYCDNCMANEVCLSNDLELDRLPACHRIKNNMDPTGCGGLCKVEYQICQRLGHKAYRYEIR